jgi:hypothetical protein
MEITDMYATPPETANAGVLCSWPSEAPPKPYFPNEIDLVARLQARDEVAFREIVERYGSKVYQISYGILRNPDDADEIAQEVVRVQVVVRAAAGAEKMPQSDGDGSVRRR